MAEKAEERAERRMSADRFITEWSNIEAEYQQLQETHKVYRQKLEELTHLQTVCSSAISRQRKNLKELSHSLHKYRCAEGCEDSDAQTVTHLQTQMKEKQNFFLDMEAYLPKKNGLYLNLVLGNVNVTLLSNQAKFAYKDEYEKFKLCLTIILMLGAISCLFFLNYRVTDEIFNFLLVWYYCTLTIRESILINNGSRIKGWWVLHHYVSTFLSGVMLTWPEGPIYQTFRSQFLAFSIFQRNRSSQRKPTQTWGEHANSTQKGPGLLHLAVYSSCSIIIRGGVCIDSVL
ncbi:transmembrane protein 120B isoform X2 [Trichomycterus rosablanca]|uniref:transmembrane protein 120B isoform X2 n=1 Tax=Trichomycterus rosablanca TaxID=2290929 RepID=UPI002F35DD64